MASTALARLKDKYAAQNAARARRVRAAVDARKHTFTAVGSSFALGWAEGQGWDLPNIPGFSPAATIGVVAYLAAEAKVGGSDFTRIAQSVADGHLSIAAHEFGKEFAGGGGGGTLEP